MSRLSGAALTHVEQNIVIRPVHFVFMDFLGDPMRANDSGMTLVMSGSADPDFNATFQGVTADFASISPIKVGAGGTDTVTARLSGIKTLDDDTLDIIGDETKWKGRLCKVWRAVWNQANVQQGVIEHFYTGYMVDVMIGGSTSEQYIEITIETYLAAYVHASNRTYDQSAFDPGDRSFEASVSLANGGDNGHSGAAPGAVGGLTPGPGAGGGIGSGGPGMYPIVGGINSTGDYGGAYGGLGSDGVSTGAISHV